MSQDPGPTLDHSDARRAVEAAAAAIAEGDLGEVNRLLHPRAVAQLARLAGQAQTAAMPTITSFRVADAGGTGRKPIFEIRFAGDSGVAVNARVEAVHVAASWRIGAFLDFQPVTEDAKPEETEGDLMQQPAAIIPDSAECVNPASS